MSAPPPETGIQTRPAPPLPSPALPRPGPPAPAGKPANGQGGEGVAKLVVLFLALAGTTSLALVCLVHLGDAAGSPSRPAARDAGPRQVEDFTPWVNRGVPQGFATADVVSVRYDGAEELHGCQVTVQVWYEDRQSPSFDRLWAVWAPAETKVLYFTGRGASVEYVQVRGTAQANGQPVQIDKTWEMRPSRR